MFFLVVLHKQCPAASSLALAVAIARVTAQRIHVEHVAWKQNRLAGIPANDTYSLAIRLSDLESVGSYESL